MSILCRIFSPIKHPNKFLFSSSSSSSHLINQNNLFLTSVLDSFHQNLNWKSLSQKFSSCQFSQPIVKSILLQLKEPIHSKKALNFFHWSAKELQLQHGLSNYCLTIHILVKARLINDANALLSSLLSTNDSFLILRSLIDSYDVVDSVPFVFDFFVRTCARLRMIDGLVGSCKLLFDHGFMLSLASYNIMLHVIQKSDTSRLVWGVYEHMVFTRVYLNEVTVRIMIDAMSKEGRLDKFVDIVAKMNGKRCSTPVVIVNTCLLYDMIENDKIVDGLVLLKRFLQRNMILDTVSYSLVIFAKVEKGNLDSGKEALEEMLKRGFEENAFVCSVFIKRYCEEGRMDEAVELFEKMEPLSLRPLDETYNQLIEGCARNGRLENSVEFCEKMVQLSICPSCSTINKMFEKLCESGNPKQADYMLTVLLDKGFIPDENTYCILIDGYARDNKVEGAMKILYEMEYRSIFPNVLGFSSLIIVLCKHGRMREADKYLQTMKAQLLVPNTSVYDSLIAAHLQKGNKKRAHQLQIEMIETTLEVDERLAGPCSIHTS